MFLSSLCNIHIRLLYPGLVSMRMMCQHVSLKMASLVKRHVTDMTLVWLLSSVDPLMCRQVVTLYKPLATVATFVRLLSCVDFGVKVQIEYGFEALSTYVTLVWLFFTVCSPVKVFVWDEVMRILSGKSSH